jgi:hypothetical protein
MCPIHKGGRVHGCKICAQSISTIKYLNNDVVEEIRTYQKDLPVAVIAAPAPKPPPPPPVDPMIVLADLADEIDRTQRVFRMGVWELVLVFMVAAVGMSTMLVGLFAISPLFWVSLPFVIGGVGCVPVTIAATQRKYLAIWDARAEFAKAQRRVSQ